jgi:endonuclease/exonuclease/phosphatase family metal-dependent hydrolase
MVASPHRLTDTARYRLPGYLKHDPDTKTARLFHLTCSDVSLPRVAAGSVRACATHLRSGYETHYRTRERTAQDHAIRTLTQPWINRGQKVVVAGDFNAKPTDPTLDAVYNLSRDGSFTGSGSFVEADQTDHRYFSSDPECHVGRGHCRTGQPTIGAFSNCSNVDHGKLKKYDYIFYSRGSNYDLHGEALPCNGSDHLPIRSRATLPLPAA